MPARPSKAVYESILQAAQALGFERVRIDLLSQDGSTIVPAAARGHDGNDVGEPMPASDDPDLARLLEKRCPQVACADACEAGSDAIGGRGFVPISQSRAPIR